MRPAAWWKHAPVAFNARHIMPPLFVAVRKSFTQFDDLERRNYCCVGPVWPGGSVRRCPFKLLACLVAAAVAASPGSYAAAPPDR